MRQPTAGLDWQASSLSHITGRLQSTVSLLLAPRDTFAAHRGACHIHAVMLVDEEHLGARKYPHPPTGTRLGSDEPPITVRSLVQMPSDGCLSSPTSPPSAPHACHSVPHYLAPFGWRGYGNPLAAGTFACYSSSARRQPTRGRVSRPSLLGTAVALGNVPRGEDCVKFSLTPRRGGGIVKGAGNPIPPRPGARSAMADKGRPPKIVPPIPASFDEVLKAVVKPAPQPDSEQKQGAA